MIRKTLFWLHLIAGVIAGAVILMMSVTGVLLTYEKQMVAWSHREFRSQPMEPGAPRLPLNKLTAAVKNATGAAPASITIRSDATAPLEAPLDRGRVLFIDVYSGKVLGESTGRLRRFFQDVTAWHRWFGATVKRDLARGITGACNLAFLFLVISGPFLWWPKRWSAAQLRATALFRFRLSGRARDFNWHNVAGIWTFVPLLVIVASGAVISYPWAGNLVYKITGTEPPAPAAGPARGGGGPGGGPPREGRPPNEAAPIELDKAWARAEERVPGWKSVVVRMPPGGRGPVTLATDAGTSGRPDLRGQLSVNARTGEVIRWEPFSSYNAGRKTRNWLRFLHTGEALGWIGQTVAGIASACAALLVWTGIALSLRRFATWKKSRRKTRIETEVAA